MSSGVESEEGCPLPSQLWGLGERFELPQWGPRQNLGERRELPQ